jgi:hypothetical protein
MPMSGHRYATRGAVNGRRWPTWLVHAFILEAIARDALGHPAAADRAMEHALDLAECP